jgi:MmgE/PrpD N-terminal domain
MGPAGGGSEVLTTRGRTSPMFAAMVNAAASHFVEQDDVHNGSVSHPATVVFPPALAVAQALGSSGRELLTAAVAGYERPCAECLRMSTRLVKRFPHSAALCEQEGVHHPADDEEIHLFGEMPSTSIFLETLGPPTIAATGRCGASRANFVHRSARRMRAESRGADAAVPDFGPDAKKARRTSTTWRPGSGLAW